MADDRVPVRLRINGEQRIFEGDPLTPLVDVLRHTFFLTGAKASCREGFCGGCTVHIDGIATLSCLRPVALLEGSSVVTIEGLAGPGASTPLQQALEEHDVVQCGMCFPGIVMSLTAFLDQHSSPDRAELKAALSGNICRCTGYERIIDAVLSMRSDKEHMS